MKNLLSRIPTLCVVLLFVTAGLNTAVHSQSLTPQQAQIEKQRQRLTSGDVEERRDALMRLSAMRRPDAARAAQAGLSDTMPMVRATAASAVIALPSDEAAAALIPLLSDKDEFVRQHAAYALGATRSRTGVAELVQRLRVEKMDSVRAAAVVALGEIGDDAAVVPLVELFSGSANRKKPEKNEFILRAAAHSLGQIHSKAAVPGLISVLTNENLPTDAKREAAVALGIIGDPSAAAALQTAAQSDDVYLSHAANQAIRRLAAKRAN